VTLSSALSSANSGLATTARRADIVAGNIANATTPGYVRRSLNVGEIVLAGKGQGVRALGVDRAQDVALTRERRQAGASAARADVVAQGTVDLFRELGIPGDGYGLFATYQGVESVLRELSVTPESVALQNAGVNALGALAAEFNELHAIGQNQRITSDNAIARAVRDVNAGLHRIQGINGQIAGLGGRSGEIAALEDERQRVLDDISQTLPIRVLAKEHGQIDVMTEEGVFLLAGNVSEITFGAAGVIAPGAEYDGGNGSLSGLMVGDQNLTPNSNGHFAVSGGTLAGLFTLRDQVAPDFLSGLDSLAADLIARFSDDGLDSTKTAGAPGIFTDAGAALDTANITGIAGRMRINAALDKSQGGQPSNLRDGLGAIGVGTAGNADVLNNLLNAFTQSSTAPSGSGLLGALTSTELAAGFSSLMGESRVNADAVATTALARAGALADAELSMSGVDTDAEMQSLLLIEESYAANARVIQTISEMLDILMQI